MCPALQHRGRGGEGGGGGGGGRVYKTDRHMPIIILTVMILYTVHMYSISTLVPTKTNLCSIVYQRNGKPLEVYNVLHCSKCHVHVQCTWLSTAVVRGGGGGGGGGQGCKSWRAAKCRPPHHTGWVSKERLVVTVFQFLMPPYTVHACSTQIGS